MNGSDEERLRFEDEEVERLIRTKTMQDLSERELPIDVALVGSGIPKSVALVGCGKAKLSTTEKVRASDLYIGNPFKLSYQYARLIADDVHILSALHGLLAPHELVAPYNFSMTQMLVTDHYKWGQRIISALKAAYPLTHLRLTIFAGRQYVRPILNMLTDQDRQYWTIEDPLEGLDLFARNRWLKKRLEALDGPPF